MSMLMLTSLTYVETEQYLVVLFLVTAPRLIVRAGRGRGEYKEKILIGHYL